MSNKWEQKQEPTQKNLPTTRTYYEILGVSPNATPAEIKAARNRLALNQGIHPDQGGDGEEMTKINAAYEILTNPEARAKYDKSIPSKPKIPKKTVDKFVKELLNSFDYGWMGNGVSSSLLNGFSNPIPENSDTSKNQRPDPELASYSVVRELKYRAIDLLYTLYYENTIPNFGLLGSFDDFIKHYTDDLNHPTKSFMDDLDKIIREINNKKMRNAKVTNELAYRLCLLLQNTKQKNILDQNKRFSPKLLEKIITAAKEFKCDEGDCNPKLEAGRIRTENTAREENPSERYQI